FGRQAAVDNLSFTVHPGEVFGLLGPNGSGKTTTINLISGLAAATGGRVTVFGRDPRRQAGEVRRRLGVVPQETALYEELTAERNLVFHAELYGIPRRERRQRVTAMLELAQLSDRARTRVDTFSGGMKRRLAIVRALLHDPELVYLDEPTLGVDVQARHVIWDHIRDMQAAGRTVLLSTNYLEESDQLCDRIAVIDHGRLVALDTPARLKSRFGSGLVEIQLAGPPAPELVSRLDRVTGVQEVQVEDQTLRLVLASDPAAGTEEGAPGAVLPRILAAVGEGSGEIRGLTMREPSLDEVFLTLTGKGVRD
ncbi:MAG: ATP-binding cassette domain-containing protein, partial [Candidatus Dormiibacterota bacterium]